MDRNSINEPGQIIRRIDFNFSHIAQEFAVLDKDKRNYDSLPQKNVCAMASKNSPLPIFHAP
jgi:hypothetical protein